MPSGNVASPPLIDVRDVHLIHHDRTPSRGSAHCRCAGKMPVSDERPMPRSPPRPVHRDWPECPPRPTPRVPPRVPVAEPKSPGHRIAIPDRADPRTIVVTRTIHHRIIGGDV